MQEKLCIRALDVVAGMQIVCPQTDTMQSQVALPPGRINVQCPIIHQMRCTVLPITIIHVVHTAWNPLHSSSMPTARCLAYTGTGREARAARCRAHALAAPPPPPQPASPPQAFCGRHGGRIASQGRAPGRAQGRATPPPSSEVPAPAPGGAPRRAAPPPPRLLRPARPPLPRRRPPRSARRPRLRAACLYFVFFSLLFFWPPREAV